MATKATTLKDLFLEAAVNIDATLKQRGKTYGEFIDNAYVAQELKRVIRTALQDRQRVLYADQLEALDMFCHKIARIVNGDSDYADSWVDIAGYAKLVADRLQAKEYERSEIISHEYGGTD